MLNDTQSTCEALRKTTVSCVDLAVMGGGRNEDIGHCLDFAFEKVSSDTENESHCISTAKKNKKKQHNYFYLLGICSKRHRHVETSSSTWMKQCMCRGGQAGYG